MSITTGQLGNFKTACKDFIDDHSLYIGIGTGTTAPTAGDTALETEVDRNARNSSYGYTDGQVITAYFSTTEANGYTITEVADFNESSGGTMYSRNLITGTAKTSSIELWIDLKYDFTVAEV